MVFVSTGQHYYFCKRLAIRIAAGAWFCGAFFIVQIYCSTLTSHLTSPNQKLLVNSFFEMAENHDVSLAVDRGYAIDKILQVVWKEHKISAVHGQGQSDLENLSLLFLIGLDLIKMNEELPKYCISDFYPIFTHDCNPIPFFTNSKTLHPM